MSLIDLCNPNYTISSIFRESTPKRRESREPSEITQTETQMSPPICPIPSAKARYRPKQRYQGCYISQDIHATKIKILSL